MKKYIILGLLILLPILAFAFTYDWEIDYMEYATDGAAQTAYVSSDTTLDTFYPPAHNATYVKSTTDLGSTLEAHQATDPANSLTGVNANNEWVASGTTSQRFHVDLGAAVVVTKVYYENGHYNGGGTDIGAQNFTIWGSNTAASFAELTYATDTGWTEITPSQSTFDQHVGADQADPKYLTLTNSTAYRYYAFKFADNYGSGNGLGVRRLELQTATLQSYSEDTIVEQGTYSLKGVATDGALNETLTRTIGDNLDLSNMTGIEYDIYALRTGSNIKIGIHDSGGTTSEHTANVASSNVNQTESWDISGVSDANKDDIDSIIVTIVNADAANTFFLDDLKAGLDAVSGGSFTWVQ